MPQDTPPIDHFTPREPPVVSTQIGVFAKYWTPGLVKTRLAKTLGDQLASEVARLFIETLLARLGGVADACVVGFAPSDKEDLIAKAVGSAWRLQPQCDGNLGQRMHHYFASSFAAGADRVVLLGADSPNLPLDVIKTAFDALEHSDLVLSPTDDGGYCLIGARNEPPPVFDDMPWSAESLWQATTDRLEKIGWRRGEQWRELLAWYDVDDASDLDRLRADLASAANDPPLARLRDELDRLLPVAP